MKKIAHLANRSVCIVDDDVVFREMISLQLRDYGIEVWEASTGPDLFEILQAHHVDCILMDYFLAADTGLLVHDQLRNKLLNSPPVIMLTATDNQRTIIKAFRTGIIDYLFKRGLRFGDLIDSLGWVIQRRTQDDAFKAELDRLKGQSNIDGETGVYRSDAIQATLAGLAEMAGRSGTSFAIVIVRLNEFERITFQVGHVAAKKVLAAFAAQLRAHLRATDACGRGDAGAFVYIVDTGATRTGVETLIERLRKALSFTLQHDALSLSISADFGMAMFPEDGDTPAELLQSARSRLSDIMPPDFGDGASAVFPMGTGTGERRQHPRRRVFKSAKILSDGGRTVLDCTVHDMSTGGVQLRIAADFNVPAQFDVLIDGSGPVQPARRVWRHRDRLGVAFMA